MAIKIQIPRSPEDLNLLKVQQILLLSQREDLTDLAKQVHSLAIATGEDPQRIARIDPFQLAELFNSIIEMINGGKNSEFTRIVTYQGRRYGFIPDIREMETGAFIDIDTMAQKETSYAQNIHKIMAVLYREIDAEAGEYYRLKGYSSERSKDREQRQAIFLRYMTLDIVRGAVGFFLNSTKICCNISGEGFPKVGDLARKIMQKAGAGIDLSTQ